MPYGRSAESEWIQKSQWRGTTCILLYALIAGLTGCNNLQGKMEWVQPTSTLPRVGQVYCIRGWHGIWSLGIDEIAKQLNAQGVSAHVFMPEQQKELTDTIVARYRNSPQHEPICFIGHSWGVDASLIIARELEKVGVNVDVIVCLDSVDQTKVPKNVRICHNYWMPGYIGDSNLLRGIPLAQEPGSTGQLFNYNCNDEYRSWRSDWDNHVNFDDDPKIQKRIVDNVLEVCPERSKWVAPVRASSTARPF